MGVMAVKTTLVGKLAVEDIVLTRQLAKYGFDRGSPRAIEIDKGAVFVKQNRTNRHFGYRICCTAKDSAFSPSGASVQTTENDPLLIAA
jgi:hypothetical protein